MGLISNGTTIFDAGALDSGVAKGAMTFIKKLTTSSSGTLSFVDGASSVVLDGTYKEYVFTFNNIHSSSEHSFQVNFRDGGTAYDATKTSAGYRAYHFERDNEGDTGLGYEAALDLAQDTAFQGVGQPQSSGDNDSSGSGFLHLFNPSSTTFVKHFFGRSNVSNQINFSADNHCAGYGNTTSAVNAVQFKFNSGNIDAGFICLYGIA